MRKMLVLSGMMMLAMVTVVFAESTAVVDTLTTTVDTLISKVGDIVEAANGMKAGDVTIWIVMAAVIKLLISLMKFKPVAKLLDSPKAKAIKPYIALILGIAGGFIASVSTGQPIVASLIAGATAGLGATGIHEVSKSVMKKNG